MKFDEAYGEGSLERMREASCFYPWSECSIEDHGDAHLTFTWGGQGGFARCEATWLPNGYIEWSNLTLENTRSGFLSGWVASLGPVLAEIGIDTIKALGADDVAYEKVGFDGGVADTARFAEYREYKQSGKLPTWRETHG